MAKNWYACGLSWNFTSTNETIHEFDITYMAFLAIDCPNIAIDVNQHFFRTNKT